MKNKNKKFFVIGLIIILLILLIITIFIYNNKINNLNSIIENNHSEINNLNSIVENNNSEVSDLNLIIENNHSEINELEREVNSNLNFYKKYNLIQLYISKAEKDNSIGNISSTQHTDYESNTDLLYSVYNINDYDYDYSESLLVDSIGYYNDCIKNILEINKLFTELPNINDNYLVNDISLRKEQVNKLEDLCTAGKKSSESLKSQIYSYYVIDNYQLYSNEYDKYTQEMIPAYNQIVDEYDYILKKINVHLGLDVYYTN